MEHVDLHWCKEALNETISQICSSKSLLLECFWWASTWKASGHRMYPANAMVSYFHRWAWPHGATFLVGFAATSEKLFEDASSEFRSEYKSMHACIHAYEKPPKLLMKKSSCEALSCLESGSEPWKTMWRTTKKDTYDTLQNLEIQLVHSCLRAKLGMQWIMWYFIVRVAI